VLEISFDSLTFPPSNHDDFLATINKKTAMGKMIRGKILFLLRLLILFSFFFLSFEDFLPMTS